MAIVLERGRTHLSEKAFSKTVASKKQLFSQRRSQIWVLPKWRLSHNPETAFFTELSGGLVPRYPLQKPPSRGLEGSGGEGGGGGGDEGLKVEGGFTFGRLQGGFKGASRGLQGGFKGA